MTLSSEKSSSSSSSSTDTDADNDNEATGRADSCDDEETEEELDAAPAPAPLRNTTTHPIIESTNGPSSTHPKMRIKLSLKQLPSPTKTAADSVSTNGNGNREGLPSNNDDAKGLLKPAPPPSLPGTQNGAPKKPAFAVGSGGGGGMMRKRKLPTKSIAGAGIKRLGLLPLSSSSGALRASPTSVPRASPSDLIDHDATNENGATEQAVNEDMHSDEEEDVIMARPVSLKSAAGHTAVGHGGVGGSYARSTSGGTVKSKRGGRAPPPPKTVKMPLMGSPGLLMPSSGSGSPHGPNSNTARPAPDHIFVPPQQVFEHAMAAAGYHVRTHRGSSVTRVVGDMFDSDVKLALHFPPLVPESLQGPPHIMPEQVAPSTANSDMDESGDVTMSESNIKVTDETDLPSVGSGMEKATKLLAALSKALPRARDGSKKRKHRPWTLKEMAPLSLTTPYPERYMTSRWNYIVAVDAREVAIRRFQHAEEEALEAGHHINLEHLESQIPPIPTEPEPPQLIELEGVDAGKLDSCHPCYFPKGKRSFVAHLAPECFHITRGRYFGLDTNRVADPNFCGPTAPGIAGVHASGGAGLATATTTINVHATVTNLICLSSTAPQPPPVAAAAAAAAMALATIATTPPPPPPSSTPSRSEKMSQASPPTSSGKHDKAAKAQSAPALVASSKKKPALVAAGPAATKTDNDLRKVMDDTSRPDVVDAMRMAIVQAAVHGVRVGAPARNFVGADGHIYPDAAKAFTNHGHIKPCPRCKSNKQGAYHCRLRRKHKEGDYDGGNTAAHIAEMYSQDLSTLVLPVPPAAEAAAPVTSGPTTSAPIPSSVPTETPTARQQDGDDCASETVAVGVVGVSSPPRWTAVEATEEISS